MITASKSRRSISEAQLYQRSKTQQTNNIDNITQPDKINKNSITSTLTSNIKANNVVVCITGLSERKNELHDIVISLGGRFTGDLNTEQVTHLIANRAIGSKYEAAAESNNIWIVKPSWLLECKKMDRFSSLEKGHLLIDGVIPNKDSDSIYPGTSDAFPNMTSKLDGGVLTSKSKIKKDPDSSFVTTTTRANINGDINNFVIATAEKPTPLWYLIGKVIRHGGGTHIWELNTLITHVIVVGDHLLDYETRNTILQIGIHHPNMPAILSIDWLIMSIQNKSLQPHHWFQLSDKQQQQQTKKESLRSVQTNEGIPGKRNNYKRRKISHNNDSRSAPLSFDLNSSNASQSAIFSPIIKSTLFQDCIFYIVPLSSTLSSSKMADNDQYSKSVLENDILTNGGTLLSSKTIQSNILHQRRLRWYVLYLNGQPIIDSKILHNQITQFIPQDLPSSKIMSNITSTPITPVWVKICLFVFNKEKQKKQKNKVISPQPCCSPNKYPILFQPQSWNLQQLPITTTKTFKVSISGFVNTERLAIVQLLEFMNIPFTDTLQKNNTHLIYPIDLVESVRNGSKFKRALEWKLFVVNVDWLYYVMRNGYTVGCENDFTYQER